MSEPALLLDGFDAELGHVAEVLFGAANSSRAFPTTHRAWRDPLPGRRPVTGRRDRELRDDYIPACQPQRGVLTTAADPNGPCAGQTPDLPIIFPEPDGLLTEDGGHRNRGASGSAKRPLPLLRPERSAQMRHRAGAMTGTAPTALCAQPRR